MTTSDWWDKEWPAMLQAEWLWLRFKDDLKAAEYYFSQLTGMEMPHRLDPGEVNMFAAQHRRGRTLLSEARRRLSSAQELLSELWVLWPEEREALGKLESGLASFTEWIGVVEKSEAAAKSGTLRPQDLPGLALRNTECAERMGRLLDDGLRALGRRIDSSM